MAGSKREQHKEGSIPAEAGSQLCSTDCTHVHTSCLCWAPLAACSLGLSAFLPSKQVSSSSLLSSRSMFTCKPAAALEGKDKDVAAAAAPGARWELPRGCSVPITCSTSSAARNAPPRSALTWITDSSVYNRLPESIPTCPLSPSTRW